ncbi:superoxide dismutase [Pseudobdellovibrio exovorus]|uniref:Superoxide dismutase n=1 Tax=Pseudobdellovibrio exovorus JSS TaxID=1184267 RepID=M4V5W3_9BACT|nr:superoxide dismutase [Pseudobdellovibrio exovorus]AGH94563.1 hypothetical protein A11Q_343 [Pseudobdellovibrio exovorus JSS]
MKKIFSAFIPGLAILLLSLQACASLQNLNTLKSPYKLPKLPYAENALEPIIDAETMKIHHTRHHQAYVDNLNKALEKNEKANLQQLLANVSTRSAAIRNNAGGHWNHSFFWTILTPNKEDQKIPKDLEAEIVQTFGSFDAFKAEFEKNGLSQFGSGWAWLIRNAEGKLEVTATPNQDNPLMDVASKRGTPILGIDVWEHAYYLKYQNKRAEYLKNFWEIINWKQVAKYDQEAKKKK